VAFLLAAGEAATFLAGAACAAAAAFFTLLTDSLPADFLLALVMLLTPMLSFVPFPNLLILCLSIIY
jgi:hypothetical protein